MNRQRLMFLLGGATMGALLGALYANHLYEEKRSDPLKVYQSPETADEPAVVREDSSE